ncbi:Homeodomain-like protein [Peziza echinospora]|nr:Homeodomain-like protein [Peziza echinospora]
MTDPTLYSAPNSPALASQRPLFDDAEQFADLISRRAEPSSSQDAKLKPTEQEYKVFVSAAFELCRRDPGRWLERERKYIANVPTQWATLNRVQKSPLKNVITAKPPTTVRPLAPARKQISHPAAPKVQRAPRTPKVPKPQGNFETFARDARVISPASAAAAAAARTARQPATREDTDFDSIPDMCPPTSSLNENSKFRVEWKGTPLDLSTDPHRHLLHPAEVHLASVLRLSCASYLTSKRRIFKEKIERARVNMEFRKTDSQKACKIDVNKASKLWSAYEKIGWFDAKFIIPHL